jgi:hypothetical protein
MDILKVVGIIAISVLLFSFLQKTFNFDFFDKITGFFSSLLFPHKKEKFGIEISTKDFTINSKNLEVNLNGKVLSFSIGKSQIKTPSEKSRIKVLFDGTLEKRNLSIKIFGVPTKILFDDVEISNSGSEFSLNVVGEVEKITVSNSEKMEISVEKAKIKVKEGEKNLEFDISNDKIVLEGVVSLEYSNNTFTLFASSIKTTLIKL